LTPFRALFLRSQSYSKGMGRLRALLGFGVALGIGAGCVGAEFQARKGSDGGSSDAAEVDAVRSADVVAPPRDGTVDSGEVDAERSDARESDAPGADAPASDAPFVPDAYEEPPPRCGGAYSCVASAPAGWEGPLELYLGPGAAPPCTQNFAGPSYDGHNGLNAAPASCGCSCQSAQGVQCSAVTISFADGATCSAASLACASTTLSPSTCTPIDERMNCPLAVTVDMSAASSNPSGGSCLPFPSNSIPVATWSTNGRACVSAVAPGGQSDCPGGSVCAPQSALPFQTGLCIAQSGDVACPTTGYTVKHVLFVAVDDTRGCSACGCGAVTGASCHGVVEVHASGGGGGRCTSASVVQYPLPYSCDAVQQPGDFFLAVNPTGGICQPSLATATGMATPARATTFCCIP